MAGISSFRGRLLKESNSNQYDRDKGGVVLAEAVESFGFSHLMPVPLNLRESVASKSGELQGKGSGVKENPHPSLGSHQASIIFI